MVRQDFPIPQPQYRPESNVLGYDDKASCVVTFRGRSVALTQSEHEVLIDAVRSSGKSAEKLKNPGITVKSDNMDPLVEAVENVSVKIIGELNSGSRQKTFNPPQA